jgi:Ca2+-binding RTX toxin-like protein
LLILGASLLTPTVAFSVGDPPSAGNETEVLESEPDLPSEEALTSALKDEYAAYQRALKEREEELETPASIAAREQSQFAFAGIGPSQAQDLLRSTFGDVIKELNGDPARFLSDARVDNVVERDAATVTSDGESQLLESNVPVVAKDENGDLAKVDVGVVPTTGGWELENPLVELKVGESVEEGISLPESGITLTQVGAQDSVAQAIGDKNLFYGEIDAGTDTDLLVSPISTGVELFSMLRSADSPETLRFEVEAPTGSQLLADDGGGAEVIDETGKTTALIPAPWARDAQGTTVPVRMQVEGNSLVLSVKHRDADFAYPILVDPTIYQDWGWWYSGQHLEGTKQFYFQTSASGWWAHGTYSDPGGFPEYNERGLFVWSEPGYPGADQWGQWVYTAPNADTYFAGATINPFWRRDNPCNDPVRDYSPYDYAGLWIGENGVGWHPIHFNDAKNYTYTNFGASFPNEWGRALIFGLSSDGQNNYAYCYRHLMAGGIGIWLDDWGSPSVSVSGVPAGWLKKDSTARSINVSGYDAGLGIQTISMTSPISAAWNQPWCAGTVESRCNQSRSGAIGFTTAAFSEGASNFTVQTGDPTGKQGSTSGTLYVDGSNPLVSLGAGTLTSTAYEVPVETKDGGTGEPRSGVKEVKVLLDGTLKQTKTNGCSTSGCPYTLNFTYSQSLSGLSVGQHTLEVIATDQVGYTKAATQKFNVEAPDTVIDSGPEGLTNQSTPKFAYHSTQTGSTFSCSVDGGGFVSCPATGYTTSKLSDGEHTFSVKATSAGGVADPTPASRSFTVDATPPETTIDFGPQGTVGISRPDFGYSSNEAESQFECRLDGAAFAACPEEEFTPASSLADGEHTFNVRAIDLAGNVDPTPATRSFTVDATSPVVEIKSGPEGATAKSAPTFTFSASGGTVSCAVEAQSAEPGTPSFGPCTTGSSHTVAPPLADGSYVFIVRAVDGAENEASDLRAFTVDTAAPDTSITSGPSGTTDDPKPSFGFSSNESGVSFSCRFDAASFAPCSGPGATHTPASSLADGSHSFEVRATDAAGNTDGTPAKRTFTIFTTGPQTTIDSGPVGAIGVTKATFAYSASKAASFECSLDGAAFAACGSSKELTGLSEGEHTFEVRAVASGVTDPTPAKRSFIVDTSSPGTPVVGGPLAEPGQPGMTLHVEDKDGDPSSPATVRSGVGSIRVRIDGKVVATTSVPCKDHVCPAIASRTIQVAHQDAVGAHHFAVEGEDGVGHFSALREWDENAPEAQELISRRANNPAPPNCPATRNRIESRKKKIRGSDCADLIIVIGAGKHTIEANGGDDIVLAGPATDIIHGGEGDDLIRARRSNDEVFGEGGNDTIYGGIGDDALFGGPGNDIVDGGPGGDGMVGEAGNDTIRGGQGENFYTGGDDEDTFSFADAVTPGFGGNNTSNFAGFPGSEPGIKINMPAGIADDGPIQQGGQDDVLVDHPERIIGSAFNDWIIGSAGKEAIDGGPGADLIETNGGGDEVSPDSADDVGNVAKTFQGRNPKKTEVGITSTAGEASLFLAGANDKDEVTVTPYDSGVHFSAKTGPASLLVAKAPCSKNGLTVNCPIGSAKLGVVVVSGGGGPDVLGFGKEQAAKPGAFELTGGKGSDELRGGAIEDLLVDGKNQGSEFEHLRGGAGDDAILSGMGGDVVEGGKDNDLLVTATICRPGDEIYGDLHGQQELGSDNAQFHFVQNVGVNADLEAEQLGEVGQPKGKCNNGKYETFSHVDILEGTTTADVFKGSKKTNLLLGRGGRDTLLGEGGTDAINALDDGQDRKVDCGGQGGDVAHIDLKTTPNDRKVTSHCPHIDDEGHSYPERPWVAMAESSDDSPLLADESSPPLGSDFRLDDASGTAAANGAGSGNAGTYKAAGYGPSVNGPGPTLAVPGALVSQNRGTAVSFDGIDDYVDLSGQGAPSGESGAYSVAAFVKFDRTPGEREFIFSAGDASGGAFLYRETNGRIVFATGLNPGAPEVSSDAVINDSSWHHLVGTVQGETITLYVDGFPNRLGYGTSAMPQLGKEPQSLVAAGPGVAHLLGGDIDEVMTYEGALGEAEVGAQLADSKAEEQAQLLAPAPETTDSDGDGLTDGADNCPTTANPDQADSDMNGAGDACDPIDSDGDGVADGSDNCPSAYNPEQTDSNGDGIGDECALMPPSVVTEPATVVKGSTATFNGTVDPEGLATTYQFEYGTTTSYGSKVPVSAKSAGLGASALAVSEAVTGLIPNTTYHYRVFASNEAGQTTGADQTFTTLKLPTVSTGSASAVKATTATLNATVNPEGSAATYQFAYGTTTSYGTKVPASPGSAGAGTSAVAVSEALKGLAANTTYHFRIEATNEAGTVPGKDVTFKTEAPPVGAAQLKAMPVSEPFNGSAASTSDFANNFGALGWAIGTAKGEASAAGWAPVNAFVEGLNGAYYAPVLADTGAGVAAAATMATNPANAERYFSLWLDMANPAAASRAGYELRFTDTATNTYTVTLSKWQAGAQTVLASKAGYTFVNGNSLAIVDQGSTVSVFTDTGAGFVQLLSATDSAFSSGATGFEGAGNITRLTNFKAGIPLSSVANMNAALGALEVQDSFARNESPLGAPWAALAWDGATANKTGRAATGWGPTDAFPAVNGAYWTKASYANTGGGDAVIATQTQNPTITERYFSLWLNSSNPGSVKSGYELRFTETTEAARIYEVTLSKWQSGTKTLLASKAGFSLSLGSSFALVDKGGTVSAWTKSGSEFTQLLSASDSSFISGFTGVEGAGNITRLTDFKAGPLAPF